MTFQVGEKVVYPNHGVATIENISSRAFAGNLERFYLLRITYNSLTVMVPFSHVENCVCAASLATANWRAW